jgi:uncharacterized protein YbbC (DUF1343 family)
MHLLPKSIRFVLGAAGCAALLVLASGCAVCKTGSAAGAALTAGDRFQSVEGPRVKSGLDVLAEEGFARLAGRRVGLIVNHSAISARGEHLLDLLHANPDVHVVAIFAPEHGFRGEADTHVADDRDEKTGIPVYSLYGATRVPKDEHLEGIDTLVFDIQDIGARFYTYIATMGHCMGKAQEKGLRFVVLDRPNPIQGNWFDGPIQDADLTEKFTAFVRMPVAHGMTVGEMARFYYEYHNIRPELEVVPMKGWERWMYFDETGLPWVNPSPNMRSVNEELLYTMVALTEANKNVSVGRGTDRPFEYLGAPWLDGDALADNLNARNLPGLWFMRTTFVPAVNDITGRKFDWKYQFTGEICHGVRIVVTDRHRIRPVEAGVHMLAALLEVGGEKYSVDQLRGLVGAQWVLDGLKRGEDPSAMAARWRTTPEFLDFAAKRQAVLMY